MIDELTQMARRQLPRMLTQVDRDPGSSTHGCWDRNWWHYKIRDYPSIILQQGGYAAAIASGLPDFQSHSTSLRSIASASFSFWNQRAQRHGAFEEYYPYEQGYPPLAFGSLAMAKLASLGFADGDKSNAGLRIAARQLLSRFEAKAANQQVAGTAAAAVIRKLSPELIDERAFAALVDRTLTLQHPEGWFPEYDGPDLGYLAVTMDCLWDLYDATGDERCVDAIGRGLEFISWFVTAPPGHAGMHNSRNTDYIVPYAIARLASMDSRWQADAIRVFQLVFSQSSQPDHFFAAIDDRYWCHYIGHSVLRAIEVLAAQPAPDLPAATAARQQEAHLPGTGHLRITGTTGTALVSTRKGGIVTATWPDGPMASDFGWLVRSGDKSFVTHWWSNEWNIRIDDQSTTTEGWLVSHREHLSEPWKHMALRIASFLFGRHLIAVLKRLVIFKKPDRSHRFTRTVAWNGDCVVIEDQITGVTSQHEVVRAPRTSKRHVASADSFHSEDFRLLCHVRRSEKITTSGAVWTCRTTMEPATKP